MYRLSRRKFIKGSFLLGSTAIIGGTPFDSYALSPSTRFPKTKERWYDTPMRWANLTFVETDPSKGNPDFWLDFYKRAHIDAACLSAGGYIAYYPTKVPFHYVSKFIKPGEDPFGYMVEGCRKLGMVVTARLDTHALHQEAYEGHREWIGVDYQGNPRKHPYMENTWLSCPFGPYAFEQVPQILKEISTIYSPDGIFVNRWQGTGMCYCESCKKLFRKATGMELPNFKSISTFDFSLPKENPSSAAYLEWRKNRLFEIWDYWDGIIRRINPHARFIPNMGGSLRGSIDMSEFGKKADYLTVDRQGRTGAIWTIGIAAKEFRAVIGNKPLGAGFAFGVQSKYRWIDSVHGNNGEFYMWAVEAIANGIRPSIGKTGVTVEDNRWVKEIEKLFTWHHSVEKYLRNECSLAKVAIVYSQYENPNGSEPNASLGMYQALIEARIPFEMVHVGLLDPEHVKKYKLLILPDLVALSDKQCEQIAVYANQGGSVMATYETSLYDETGNKRTDFGLAKLFGIKYLGERIGPMNNSYCRLETDIKTGKRHPVLDGWDGVNRIINTSYMVKVEATETHESYPLTNIPTYPSLPMEELYPREPNTDEPLLYLRKTGNGKVMYFPGNIDSTFDELLLEDHAILLKNCIKWASDDDSITIQGKGMYDITYWQQKESLTVHIVNLNNPMTMTGYFRELLPSPQLQVRIQIPKGIVPKKVKLLVNNSELNFKLGEYMEVTVPPILAHEIIAIDF